MEAQKKKAPKWLKITTLCLIAVVVLILMIPDTPEMIAEQKQKDTLNAAREIALAKQSEIKTPKPTDTISKMSSAKMLAILDFGEDMPEDDIRVNGIRNYLEKLSQLFSDNIDSIADYTSRGKDLLKSKGIDKSSKDILHDIYIGYRGANLKNIKYKEVIVIYSMELSSQ